MATLDMMRVPADVQSGDWVSVQSYLAHQLGIPLGTSGPFGDGVDGKPGPRTADAVIAAFRQWQAVAEGGGTAHVGVPAAVRGLHPAVFVGVGALVGVGVGALLFGK